MESLHRSEDRPCTMLDGELCNCCREMASLESQMLEGQRVLDEMAARHKRLKSERNQTHSLINRRIPPEILSAIFLFCLDSPKELEHTFDNQRHPYPFSLKLGAICRAWRDIAWSTPGLWNRFSIILDSEKILPGQIEFAQEWLGRSGDLPLALYIGVYASGDQRGPRFTAHLHPLLEIVKLYSKRWQDLYLLMWIPWISKLGMDVPATPLLRTLKLYPMGGLETTNKLWQNILLSPRSLYLHTDHLEYVTLELSSKLFRKLDIDWNNLIDLEVSHLRWDDYIQILKSSSQLTRFKISGFWPEDSFFGSDDIVHSKLQYFSINQRGGLPEDAPQSLDNFMSILHFPSLTEFDYHVGPFFRHTYASSYHCPATFLERTQQLKKLSIQLSCSLDGHEYIGILKSMPSLKHLYLMDWDSLCESVWDLAQGSNIDHISRPLLEHLAATYMNDATKNSSELFLPALQTFGYQAIFLEPPWTDILSVLGPLSEIGNINRRPLNTLHITFGFNAGEVDEANLRQLWEAKKAGIDVYIKDDDWYEEGGDLLQEVVKMRGIEP